MSGLIPNRSIHLLSSSVLEKKLQLDAEATDLQWWLCAGAKRYVRYGSQEALRKERIGAKKRLENIHRTARTLRKLLNEHEEDRFSRLSGFSSFDEIADRLRIPFPDLPVDDPVTHHIKLFRSRYTQFRQLLAATELSAKNSHLGIGTAKRGRPANNAMYDFGWYVAEYWEFKAGRRFTADYHESGLTSAALVFFRDAISPLAKVSDTEIVTAARKIVKTRNSQDFLGHDV